MKTPGSRSERTGRFVGTMRRAVVMWSPRTFLTALLGAAAIWAGCSDLRENLAPPEETGSLTYVADMKPIFDRDCAKICHNPATPTANYDLSQYDTGALGGVLGGGADTIPNVIPGDESSLLIQKVDVGGSMRRYLSGGADDAAKIRRWVVVDGARKE